MKCRSHYPTKRAGVILRFQKKVDRSGGPDACWPYTGGKTTGGYGSFSINHSFRIASRVAFAIEHNLSFDFSHEIEAMHSCDNPPCCNPKHLIGGTHTDNMRDMAAKGRAGKKRVAA